MNKNNLVNLKNVDPTLVIEARYATTNNFVGKIIYPKSDLYLLNHVAQRLKKVQTSLRKKGLRIKVWDAYRPLSVQKILWDLIQDERYVADPHKGSKHNRGCAVDITLVDSSGKELLMPTGFDDFSEHAHRNYVGAPKEALANRKILEDHMIAESFIPLPTEWWHFDDPTWEQYPILDINP